MPIGAALVDLALEVISLAKAMTSSPFDVAGHSLGGRIALKSLEMATEQIEAVIMLDIGPGPLSDGLAAGPMMRLLVEAPSRFRSRKEARDHLISRGADRTSANWLALNLGPAEDKGWVEWRIDRREVARFHERQSKEDLWHVLNETMRHPGRVICIRGGDSRYIDDSDAERMEALGVEVATVPGAGHFFSGKAREELTRLLSKISLTAPCLGCNARGDLHTSRG